MAAPLRARFDSPVTAYPHLERSALPAHRLALADSLIDAGLVCGQVLAALVSPIAWCAMRRRRALWCWLEGRTAGTLRTLYGIAVTQIARQVFKAAILLGAEATVLRRVRCRGRARLPAGGCVIALSHTPWGRIFARWSESQDFALVLGHPRWAWWTGSAHITPSLAGMRRAVAELRRGRRVAIVVDDFVRQGGYAAEFLGRSIRVSKRAVSLAAQAGVPIVPVKVRFVCGRICVRFQAARSPSPVREERETMSRDLLSDLERDICRRPAEWQDLFQFFGSRRSLRKPRSAARGCKRIRDHLFRLLVVGSGLLGACATWHVETGVPTVTTSFDSTKTYRLTLADGQRRTGTHLRISADSLTWQELTALDAPKAPPKMHGCPLSEVQQLEVQDGSAAGGSTVVLVLLGVAFLAAVLHGTNPY